MAHDLRLREFVDSIKSKSRRVPYFDPRDGESRARVLFLLEAPGRKALESGYISRDNADPTARNLKKLMDLAELNREDTALWNIVPWYIGSDTRIRAANSADVEAGMVVLKKLLKLFKRLNEIVLVGKNAQTMRDQLSRYTKLQLTDCPHPSQRVFNRWPKKKAQAKKILKGVAARTKAFIEIKGRAR